jgi:hypothetical protein
MALQALQQLTGINFIVCPPICFTCT